MKKLPYDEGDCFGVPLPNGNFAVGIVVRHNRRGRVFGHFFGPPMQAPAIDAAWRPEHAVLTGRFGDLGLIEHKWPVLGKFPGWDRNAWPFPRCFWLEPFPGRDIYFREYDERDFVLQNNVRVSRSEANIAGIPKDGDMGYVFVEKRLARLLGMVGG